MEQKNNVDFYKKEFNAVQEQKDKIIGIDRDLLLRNMDYSRKFILTLIVVSLTVLGSVIGVISSNNNIIVFPALAYLGCFVLSFVSIFGVYRLNYVYTKENNDLSEILEFHNKTSDQAIDFIIKAIGEDQNGESFANNYMKLLQSFSNKEKNLIKKQKKDYFSDIISYSFIIGMILILLSFVNTSGFLNKARQSDNNNLTSVTTDDFSSDSTNVKEDKLLVDLDKICECEKEFKEAYPIEWSGHVISIFLSGEAIGVKRFDQSGKYKQFMVRTNGLYDGGGDKIRIKGNMVGMTCAYYNTIFGECVPDVVATAIEIIK